LGPPEPVTGAGPGANTDMNVILVS
jgi:hypothetical protein